MTFWLTAAATAAVFVATWALSVRLRDASVVDIVWGPGFGVIALVAFLAGDGSLARRALVLALAGVWGLRLGLHIGWRNRGAGEDVRYAAMRERHGERFPLVSLWRVFLLQAAVQWVVSLPLQVAAGYEGPLGWVEWLAAGIWAAGLAFEAIGDAQLRRFKADPANAGEVLDRGLWRYTRHPNYFGDATVWWGLFVLALREPVGWWTIASPVLMTLFLTRISGVPMLERRMMETKPGYRDYADRTSAFFPLPARDQASRGSSRKLRP